MGTPCSVKQPGAAGEASLQMEREKRRKEIIQLTFQSPTFSLPLGSMKFTALCIIIKFFVFLFCFFIFVKVSLGWFSLCTTQKSLNNLVNSCYSINSKPFIPLHSKQFTPLYQMTELVKWIHRFCPTRPFHYGKYLFTGSPTLYISPSTILTQTCHYSVICSFDKLFLCLSDHDRPLFPCADGTVSHPCPLDTRLPLAAATSWN